MLDIHVYNPRSLSFKHGKIGSRMMLAVDIFLKMTVKIYQQRGTCSVVCTGQILNVEMECEKTNKVIII